MILRPLSAFAPSLFLGQPPWSLAALLIMQLNCTVLNQKKPYVSLEEAHYKGTPYLGRCSSGAAWRNRWAHFAGLPAVLTKDSFGLLRGCYLLRAVSSLVLVLLFVGALLPLLPPLVRMLLVGNVALNSLRSVGGVVGLS